MSYPDAVELVRTALLAGGVDPVVADVPNPRPTLFTRLQLVGTARLGKTHVVHRVVIESWAATKKAAHDLAKRSSEIVEDEMQATVVAGVPVGATRVIGGPSDFPDPLAHVPRFVQTATLITPRGTAA